MGQRVKKLNTLNFENLVLRPDLLTTHSLKSNYPVYLCFRGLAVCLVLFSILVPPLMAETRQDLDSVYKVESIEVLGSARLSGAQIYQQLRISDSTLMSDEWLSEARQKLLGMAVYKNVFFALRKGSKPGFAKLVISAVDDDSVISNWAAGGEFGLALVKPSPDISDDSVFKSYKFGLVARNILNRSHRGALLTEIATDGNIAQASLAYGLPRFAFEAIQFDTAISVVDPTRNYLDTEGFGMEAQTLWTRHRAGLDLNYGLVWYSNRHERYTLKNWPSLVSGPKLGIIRETRLRSFLPQSGYKAELSIVPSLVNRQHATIEAELLRTDFKPNWGALTYAAKVIQIGRSYSTLRGELKYELPITTSSHGLRSLLYFSRRLGQDRHESSRYFGAETVAGYRYHSSGFIGDINFRIASDNPFSVHRRDSSVDASSGQFTNIGGTP